MTLNFSRLACIWRFCDMLIFPIPPNIVSGRWDRTLSNVPILLIISICAYMSVKVNLPDISLCVSLIASCSSMSSGARSMSPLISPIPSSLEMNLSDSNFSKSPIFSPSPTKTIGAPVVDTALSAPPPLAVPSSFVTMVPVTPTSSWNVAAIGPAAWPTCASITRNLSEAFAISAISSNSSFSSPSRLSLPAVSIITTSAVPTFLSPFLTIFAASLSSGSPYTSIPVPSRI